jgi:hypothetical protein
MVLIGAITGGSGAVFDIMDGVDNNWFDIDDDELTFKATAFEARNNATYRVKIKADLGTPASFFDRAFSGKHNHLVCVFRRRNISRGNTKHWYILPIVIRILGYAMGSMYQCFVLPRLMFLRLKTQTR